MIQKVPLPDYKSHKLYLLSHRTIFEHTPYVQTDWQTTNKQRFMHKNISYGKVRSKERSTGMNTNLVHKLLK